MESTHFNATVHNLRIDRDGEARLQLDIPLTDVSKVLPLAGLQANLVVTVTVSEEV